MTDTKFDRILKIFKKYGYTAAVVAILIFSFIYRINTLYFLIEGNDAYRDYLVAHHILKYHEYPSVGPMGFFGHFNNSPVYYYLLSLFLLIKDEFQFLGYINILLFLLTIIIIYFIGKEIFNKHTGLVATMLYSLSFIQFTNKQTVYIWQPWVMMPFINLSLLLLVLYYKKRNYPLLIFSIVMLILSAAIHPSAFYAVPFFFIIVSFLLIKSVRYLHLFYAFLTAIITLLLLYSPVFLYGSDVITNNLQAERLVLMPSGIYNNLSTNLTVLVNTYFLNDGSILFIKSNLLLIIMLIIFLLSLLPLRKGDKSYVILFGFIIQPLIFTTFIKPVNPVHIGHYFVPVLGLLCILITGLLDAFLSKNVILRIVKILIILILVKSLYTAGISSALSGASSDKPKMHTAIQIMQAANDSIKNAVLKIKNKENFQDYDFFIVRAYRADEEWSNALFWMYLEKDLNKKFVKISNDNGVGFTELNNNQYIFLVCFKFLTEEKLRSCSNAFSQRYTNYSITKQIYSQFPFVIYETKRWR